ncbi:hypothetical protein G9A89_018538 [Geosiphon pyriformis]|nr:hypothetical protein G9A89_018538 [Geosiphon pyriformis]
MTLKDKVLFISGASRGIGLAIALRAARDGALITIAAKTATFNPKLPGTIYTAAEEIERAGGKALPLICDIRDEKAVQSAIQKTVDHFGGIDIVVNNASAISLTNTQDTTLKKYNLMHEINSRGTWLVTKYAIPHLLESAKKNRNPHILSMSPPLSMQAKWFSNHVAYTMSKYGMSMCILGWAEEFRGKVAANALWPLTGIETAALKMLDITAVSHARKPEIMADAAYLILTKPVEFTGNFLIDELILRENGQTEFDHYAVTPGNKKFFRDFYIEDNIFDRVEQLKKDTTSKL